jgi:RNA polymerase sigma-70 factor (ECF subfamily)
MSSAVKPGEHVGKASAEDLETFFRDHYQLVYRTAYSVTGRQEDAEDIVQTVFLKLLHREDPLNLGTNPNGYLYRAALNLALDTIRKRKRHVLIFDNKFFESTSRASDNDGDEDLDSRLWKAISELHPASAQILILRYVHNYSLTDIAKTLDSTRGTVAVSLFRSRSRLKKLIREWNGEKS